MDCKFAEQLSLLMDGELNEDEARLLKSHLTACAICQQVQADFQLLRREIQAYQPQPNLPAQRQALQHILQSERTPFWRKKIALPAPAFALLLLALAIISLWAISARKMGSPQSEVPTETGMNKPLSQLPTNGFDLSKFDQGERAVIYTATRTPSSTVPQ